MRRKPRKASDALPATRVHMAHLHAVIAACKELNIPIFGYSPVARGIITSSPLGPDTLEGLLSLSPASIWY
jgi:aryl-alcohol dehydrogenase-like predicted oxidoreductase